MDNQDCQISNARVFDPRVHHGDLNYLPDAILSRLLSLPTNLINSDPDTGVSNLMVYLPREHPPFVPILSEIRENIIVVTIAGERKIEATTSASFGVWFGTSSMYNTNGLLPVTLPRTTQAAELYAVKIMLETIRDKIQSCSNIKVLDHIIIVTDSLYLKDSMSKDIWKWETNGYMTARKTTVANSDILKGVQKLVKAFEEKKVAVQFWLIEKKFNLEARRSALEILGVGEVEILDAMKKRKKKPNRNQKKEASDGASGGGTGMGANGTEAKDRAGTNSDVHDSNLIDSTMDSTLTTDSAIHSSAVSSSTMLGSGLSDSANRKIARKARKNKGRRKA